MLELREIVKLGPAELIDLRERAVTDPEAARSYVAASLWRRIDREKRYSHRAKVQVFKMAIENVSSVRIKCPATTT